MNMNLPGLLPYARLIEEDAARRFGTYEDAPLRDTFAREEMLALQARSTGVSIEEHIAHQLYATQERQTSVATQLRVRWPHWKTDRDAPRQEWKATQSIS